MYQTFAQSPGRLALKNCLLALVTLGLLNAADTAPLQAQQQRDSWEAGWRAPPPPRSIKRMRKSVAIGRDRGHRVRIRGVEITDPRFNPFMMQISISGEKDLGIYKATFTTDQGVFETELPRKRNARLQAGLANAPTSPDASLTIMQTEERTFNIDNNHALMLMNSTEVQLTLTGRVQQRTYVIKPKPLATFKAWLGPLMKKYMPRDVNGNG